MASGYETAVGKRQSLYNAGHDPIINCFLEAVFADKVWYSGEGERMHEINHTNDQKSHTQEKNTSVTGLPVRIPVEEEYGEADNYTAKLNDVMPYQIIQIIS